MEAEAQAQDTAAPQPIAWETKEGKFFERVWRTIKQVLLQPKIAFTPPFAKDFGPALYFGIMMGLFGALASNIWDMILVRDGGVISGFFVVTALAQVALTLLVGSGLCHAFLWALRGAHGGFATTLRVMSYCQAGCVLFVIPYVGELAGYLWSLAALAIGLSAAHGTSRARSLLAVLAMVVVILLFAGLFMVQWG